MESSRSVNTRSSAHWRNKHRVVWAGAKNVKQFLETIRPYAITKRDQIDFMFDVFFPYYEATTKTRKQVPDEVVLHRHTLAKLFSAMKRIEYAIPETKITNNKTIQGEI